jgi:hypothetical protein
MRDLIKPVAREKNSKPAVAERPTKAAQLPSGDLEMRRSPRLFMNLQINYQQKSSEGWKSGHTVNASKEGLSIFTTEQLKVRQNFQIRFPYPTPQNPLEMGGKVLWIRPILKEGFRSGIKIVEISGKNQIRFEELLADFGVPLY